MIYVIVDIETYYDSKGYTLKKLSIPEYVHHPDFRVHCLGAELNGETKILWGEDSIRQWLKGWEAFDKPYCFVMHNAYFDAAVMAWKYGFSPRHMLCTRLMANHVLGPARGNQSNSLASLAERFCLDAKDRLDFMDGVQHPGEEHRKTLEMYLRKDLYITREVFNRLLPRITNADTELWLIDHTLRLFTERLIPLDTVHALPRAERLIEERRDSAIRKLAQHPRFAGMSHQEIRKRLTSNRLFEQDLADAMKAYGLKLPRKPRPITHTERQTFEALLKKAREDPVHWPKFQAYMDRLKAEGAEIKGSGHDWVLGAVKHVPALSKRDEDFIALIDRPYEGVADLVNARLMERSATSAAARLERMKKISCGTGKLPVYLVYYGAHTGRWAGSGGFNWLNLTNPDRERDAGAREVAEAIRSAIVAPEGHCFVAADCSQIEARVSACLARDWKLLSAFKHGKDVYSQFISEVLGEEIRKPAENDSPERAAYLKLMRCAGKEAVLGLSYSMGPTRFGSRLRSNPELSRMFRDGKLDAAFCQKVVDKYREVHRPIVRYWKELMSAFEAAARGNEGQAGRIRFEPEDPIRGRHPDVRAILPSGRALHYRGVRREWNGRDGYDFYYAQDQRVYGGMLLENVTQAVSRDILVETIIRAEVDAGYAVVLHVYDSVVLLVKEEQGEQARDWLISSLKTPPDWISDSLPLAAEGKVGRTLVT